MIAAIKKAKEPDDISEATLKILWFGRLHPSLNSKWVTLFVCFNILCSLCILILGVKGVSVSYNSDLFFMTECLQTCIFGLHTIIKILLLHNQKKAILSLLKKKSKFWKITDVADDELYTECISVLNVSKMIIRAFLMSAILSGIAYNLQPFTTGALPSGCYIPEGWFSFLVVLMGYITYLLIVIVVGTDCFFCSLASLVIVQFKLLIFKLRNMELSHETSQKTMWTNLQTLVDYHNFLLKYCEELNTIFSGVFLALFGKCIVASSMSVFIFMQPGNLSNRLKFVAYFLTLIIETGFYCIPLEVVTNTAHELANAMYESQWYNVKTKQFKKCLTLVIRRAQKPISFTGYGLINMNLRTYVLICKTVFSFYTYLDSIQKLSNK